MQVRLKHFTLELVGDILTVLNSIRVVVLCCPYRGNPHIPDILGLLLVYSYISCLVDDPKVRPRMSYEIFILVIDAHSLVLVDILPHSLIKVRFEYVL